MCARISCGPRVAPRNPSRLIVRGFRGPAGQLRSASGQSVPVERVVAGTRHDGDKVAERVRAYIGLGSNLGDREANLRLALSSLTAIPTARVEGISRVYESAAVGPGDQGPYLNAAVALSCEQAPDALLDALLAIELRAGRDRSEDAERWGARTLDLDLLFYGDACIDRPGLSLPHPRLHERNFVLGPLCDLAPELVHPREGVAISELADRLRDRSALRVWPKPLEVPR